MSIALFHYRKLVAAIGVSLIMTACATTIPVPDGAVTAREKLTQLQNDSRLASLAPIEIQEAEMAVLAAEHPERDMELTRHLVLLASRKVDTATLWAQSRLYENQRDALSQASDTARLDARTSEVASARREADTARNDTLIAQNQAERARSEALTAQTQADRNRNDALLAQNQADAARKDATAAQLETAELEKQIAELNARNTERGLVVTLGDVLFATGESTIVGSNSANLGKLALFLNQYKDRTVIIEGHTDNVGSDSANMNLSQNRADAVKDYLLGAGIAANRLTSLGKGEGYPVSANDTTIGRQQNRRVEVIIANSIASIAVQ